MSEKMELADLIERLEHGSDDHLTCMALRMEAAAFLRASSPAQEPVTTEAVAWRWKVHSIWHYAGGFHVSGAEPLYAIPAPPQPGREDSELEELVAQAIWEECCPGMKWGQIDHLIYCRMAGAAIARMRALIGEPK